MQDSDNVNPFASPPNVADDFRSQLKDGIDDARTERARWTAICMLNGTAVLLVGTMLISAGNTSERDSTFFANVGIVLVFIAVCVFFLSPMLWYWLRRNQA